MLDPAPFVTFLAALVLLEITPGPDMMLVLARGIGQGRRIALLTVVGMVFVAGVVQVALLVFGLASLLEVYPALLVALQWIGAFYLIYLGARTIRASFLIREPELAPSRRVPDRTALRDGAINSLTNPKSLLFMFAFLPQFVDPEVGPVWLQLLILGSVQKLAGVLSLGGVALAAGSVGQLLQRWPRLLAWQERFTGTVLMALGVRLLVAGGPGSVR